MLFQKGFTHVAGTDEVGRGPLAGPVVAACVILPDACDPALFCDSKITNEKQRFLLRDRLLAAGTPIGIGIVPNQVIDEINILQASLLAMKKSVIELTMRSPSPDFILVDGTFQVPIDIPQETVVKGDSRSATIGAASIIAKITRDQIMKRFHDIYPCYNFIANKGYPTKQHREAIREHGTSPIHRVSFKGVKEFVKTAD